MILLTLGTYPLSFDRLIRVVDELVGEGKIDDEVFAQIGHSSYTPRNVRFERVMDKENFDEMFQQASSLIGHAGMGTIIMALDQNKPLLVVPRLKSHGEIVNNHQVETAKKFEELGHVLVAYNEEDVLPMIKKLKNFKPKSRHNQADQVALRIGRYLESL